MDEGTCLENRHTLSAYRGFESRPLRQVPIPMPLYRSCISLVGVPLSGVITVAPSFRRKPESRGAGGVKPTLLSKPLTRACSHYVVHRRSFQRG